MRYRALMTMAAILAFCLTLTPAWAQDSKSTPTTSSQTTASQTDQTTPSADSSQPKSSEKDAKSTDDKDKKKGDKKKDKDEEKKKMEDAQANIDSIGNRKMGGRGLGNWYSLESEIKMGKQYAQQIESTVKLVQDPVVNEFVNRVGQNLARNSDAKVPFTIKIIDSDEINAMALPGGFFYVNSGLILAADEEAELAGVMAHEIAHVAARHGMRQMTRGNLAQLGTIPLIIFTGGWAGFGAQQAASLALPMTFMKFSRSFEGEADQLGLEYMYKAGYDPNAFVTFFEKIQTKEKKKPGTLAKVFSDHPQTPDRIEKTQEQIASALPPRDQYVVSTSEFDDVKARLAALENRRKLVDEKEGSAPSLRRSSADKKKDGKESEDDRPTLKRREGE